MRMRYEDYLKQQAASAAPRPGIRNLLKKRINAAAHAAEGLSRSKNMKIGGPLLVRAAAKAVTRRLYAK